MLFFRLKFNVLLTIVILFVNVKVWLILVLSSFWLQVIRIDLTQALRRKRPDLEVETNIYHHDNAPAHWAVDTVDTIDFLGMERLPHALYSPDLAPMDFDLIPRMKSEMRGKRYDDLDDLRMEVKRLISTYKKEWFMDVFGKWAQRHRKCILHLCHCIFSVFNDIKFVLITRQFICFSHLSKTLRTQLVLTGFYFFKNIL